MYFQTTDSLILYLCNLNNIDRRVILVDLQLRMLIGSYQLQVTLYIKFLFDLLTALPL